MAICCVSLILRRCSVQPSTPHSSGIRGPCIWPFLSNLRRWLFNTLLDQQQVDKKRPSAAHSGPLTFSRACQELILTRRNAVRPSHKLDGVTKSCDLFVTTSPPHPSPCQSTGQAYCGIHRRERFETVHCFLPVKRCPNSFNKNANKKIIFTIPFLYWQSSHFWYS